MCIKYFSKISAQLSPHGTIPARQYPDSLHSDQKIFPSIFHRIEVIRRNHSFYDFIGRLGTKQQREKERISPLFYVEQSSYREACAKFVEDDKPFSRQIRLQRGANVSTFLRRRVFGQVTELSSHEPNPHPSLLSWECNPWPFSRFFDSSLSFHTYIYIYIYIYTWVFQRDANC